MMKNVVIDKKIVKQISEHAYCYIDFPLSTDKPDMKVSWSYKIIVRYNSLRFKERIDKS